eukprot:s958_g20.t3
MPHLVQISFGSHDCHYCHGEIVAEWDGSLYTDVFGSAHPLKHHSKQAFFRISCMKRGTDVAAFEGCKFAQKLAQKPRRFLRRRPCDCCVPSWTGYNAGDCLSLSLQSLADPVFDLAFVPYVDVHCHLAEVLQDVRRREVAPSLEKSVSELTEEEAEHWKILEWLPSASSTNATKTLRGRHWELTWWQLWPRQRRAASALGYTEWSWDQNIWLLPRSLAWFDLDFSMRRHLEDLGETQELWDGWSKPEPMQGESQEVMAKIAASGEQRLWNQLSEKQQRSARALGFIPATWNMEEAADMSGVIAKMFPPGFEGCVTQGCDEESFEMAKQLALSHPLIYASFGCHPKAAWSYDDDFEKTMLEYMEACGKKVVGFGEFGLDYSHPYFGPNEENRERQRQVFVRQLEVAISKEMPLVIHSREAEDDTLHIMKAAVPQDWKVHLHSYRGSVSHMKEMLDEFHQLYVGMPGILTMNDDHAQELVRQCPLAPGMLRLLGHGIPPATDSHLPTAEQIPELSPMELCDLAWSMAKSGRWKSLKDPESEDWMACVSFMIAIPARVQELETHALATSLWSLATVPSRLVTARSLNPIRSLCQEASLRFREMEPRQVNISWSIGFISHGDGGTFLAALASSLDCRQFGAGQLVALAWSFARARPHNRDVQAGTTLALLLGPEVQLASACAAQQALGAKRLCNLLWALAKTAIRAHPVAPDEIRGEGVLPLDQMEALMRMAQMSLHTFSISNICTLAWAMAIIRCEGSKNAELMTEQIYQRVSSEMAALTPRQLAMLSWSFAKMHHISWPFLHQAVLSSLEVLEGFAGQDIANLLWASATSVPIILEDADEGEVALTMKGLEALAQKALHDHQMTPQGFANVLWACAHLSLKDDGSMQEVSATFGFARGNELHLRDLSNIAWALAIYGQQLPSLLAARASHRLAADTPKCRREMQDEAKAILGLIWAEAFTGPVNGGSNDASCGVLGARRLRDIGFQLDEAARLQQKSLLPCGPTPVQVASRDGGPKVVLDLPDRMVLLKPSGWEVDQKGEGNRLGLGRAKVSWSLWSEAKSRVSRVHEGLGKPAAHLTRGQERYSLVAIRISTGRRHQIRAHLAHAGHPVVCDAKYGHSQVDKAGGTLEQYHQDLQWCSRNFLHRYRVAWDSQELRESYEAHAVLPSELKEALAQLSPRLRAGRACPTSAKQLQWWLEGKERMLVETDAPYLPVEGHWLSHPGLIPTITARVAELKGVELQRAATMLRENARSVYGF